MRKLSLCLVVTALAVLLLLPEAGQASKRRWPVFQTMPWNVVEVAATGDVGTFEYCVEAVGHFGEVTEADCTLVVVTRRGVSEPVPVASVHLGMRPVIHYLACDLGPPPELVTDTWQVDLKRGYYEWYISATIDHHGVPYTNHMYAMNPLRVGL